MAAPPKSIFISYSTADQALADSIVARIEAEGVACWIASRDARPGEVWSDAIMRGIEGCRVMLLLITEASNQSKHVLREVNHADDVERVFLPVRVNEASPGSLGYHVKTSQWVDIASTPTRDELDRVAAAARECISRATGRPAAAKPDATPQAPVEAPRRRSRLWVWGGGGTLALLAIGVATLLGLQGTRKPRPSPEPDGVVEIADRHEAAPGLPSTRASLATMLAEHPHWTDVEGALQLCAGGVTPALDSVWVTIDLAGAPESRRLYVGRFVADASDGAGEGSVALQVVDALNPGGDLVMEPYPATIELRRPGPRQLTATLSPTQTLLPSSALDEAAAAGFEVELSAGRRWTLLARTADLETRRLTADVLSGPDGAVVLRISPVDSAAHAAIYRGRLATGGVAARGWPLAIEKDPTLFPLRGSRILGSAAETIWLRHGHEGIVGVVADETIKVSTTEYVGIDAMRDRTTEIVVTGSQWQSDDGVLTIHEVGPDGLAATFVDPVSVHCGAVFIGQIDPVEGVWPITLTRRWVPVPGSAAAPLETPGVETAFHLRADQSGLHGWLRTEGVTARRLRLERYAGGRVDLPGPALRLDGSGTWSGVATSLHGAGDAPIELELSRIPGSRRVGATIRLILEDRAGTYSGHIASGPNKFLWPIQLLCDSSGAERAPWALFSSSEGMKTTLYLRPTVDGGLVGLAMRPDGKMMETIRCPGSERDSP